MAPPRRAAAPVNAYQGGPYASAFQDATNAQSAMAREDFQQDVGGAIGGLNAIGALRSGRASVTLDNASRTFGRQIGNIAAANAGELARLNQNSAEGEANRGVQREGMAMQDRQFGQRLQFDTDGRAMDNSFRQDRAGRSDMESDRTFGFQRERANRDDFNTDRSFNASEDQRGKDNTFRDGRASRDDFNTDRAFGASEDQRGRDNSYRSDRASRSDMESDRTFGFNTDRAKRSDFESDRGFTYQQGRDQVGDQRDQRNYDRGVVESDRSFGENQRQFNVGTDMARTQARQAGQAQVWSSAVNLGAQALASKGGKAVLGKAAGAVAGKLGGAKVGAMLGSVIPGAGTLVGAGLGLVGGKVLGKIGGGIKKLFGR